MISSMLSLIVMPAFRVVPLLASCMVVSYSLDHKAVLCV